MPIGNFLESINAGSKYADMKFGFAFKKTELYIYGARPVIYNDWAFYSRLSEQDRYLFNNLDYSGNSTNWVDWSHEREWRAKPNIKLNQVLGILPSQENSVGRHKTKVSTDSIIPLLLPSSTPQTNGGQLPTSLMPIIIVPTDKEMAKIKEYIEGVAETIGLTKTLYREIKEYRNQYLKVLSSVKILSLQKVEEKQNIKSYYRLEDHLAGK